MVMTIFTKSTKKKKNESSLSGFKFEYRIV